MKKCIFIFLILVSIGIHCLCAAQGQSKIDSLLRVLKTAKDTSKANTLNALGKEYYLIGDYDECRKLSHEALQLCERINFDKGKVPAYLNTGITYFLQGNYPEALKIYSRALSIAESISDKRGIANSYNNMGLIYTYQGNRTKALELHKEALKRYEEIGEKKGILNSYNNIGIIFEEQGKYPEALKSYLGALKMAEKAGDKKAMADAYFNIGHVYHAQNNLSDAMQKYFAALRLYEETGYKQGIGHCYNGLVQCYAYKKDYKKALEVNLKAIKILESIGDMTSAAHAKESRAFLYLELDNTKDALKIFLGNLKMFQEMGDTLNVAYSHSNIGYVYYRQKKYDDAVINYSKCISLAKTIGDKDRIVSCYRSLAEVYEMKNNFKNAYTYHKLYSTLNDSMFNETKSKQIAEIQTRYETEKKDINIALLNKNNAVKDVEIKRQRLLKFSFIGGLGLVIMLLLFGYRTFRIKQALRLQDIRNKIAGDLHDDIGSTLNSISIYSEVARKKDAQQDEALEMIGDASRKIIDAMSDIVWTVNPDNDSFEKIIFRMKSLAYNLFRAKKIEFTFHSNEGLNEKKLSLEVRRNFYLIFKEAVNNLVKYSNAEHAAIMLTNEKNHIRLSIKDDGAGFDMAEDTQGNGLKNMKRRAAEMKAEFRMESGKGKGTQIELILMA